MVVVEPVIDGDQRSSISVNPAHLRERAVCNTKLRDGRPSHVRSTIRGSAPH
jgi:hypothetical protein